MDKSESLRRGRHLQRQLTLANVKHDRQKRQYLLDTVIEDDGKPFTFGVNDETCPVNASSFSYSNNEDGYGTRKSEGNESPTSCGGSASRKKLTRMKSRMKMEDRDIHAIIEALADAYDLRWNYVQNEEEDRRSETDQSEFQVDDTDFWKKWEHGILSFGRPGIDCIWSCNSSAAEFYDDLDAFHLLAAHGPIRSYCWKRLQVLESKYRLYKLEKDHDEANILKHSSRDFEHVAKVDTHIHHSACMSVKELFDYMKLKLRTAGNEIVATGSGGKDMTLKEVFSDMDLTAESLSLDALDMKINAEDAYHRFDRFNAKYNPAGQSRLREIFLKSSNRIKGKYLAELTSNVFKRLESTAGETTEMRLSIYGRHKDEWEKLSSWVEDNKLHSERNKWMIQVPRIYTVFKKLGTVHSFFDMLDNIFTPLFECTKDPRAYPKLHQFLMDVSAFDSVDDESIQELPFDKQKPPEDWTDETNPPYSYYCFYMRANINVLNKFRAMKGLNTFKFRPHCGEAGDVSHLAVAFLLADGVAHGIKLWQTPTLQYLFYLAQVGIHMSPVSNNALFLEYEKNPFPKLFARGLNVSLSTDDPCQFHSTENPLVEEYSIAAKVWRLSNCDQCEVARNSVRQSGFDSDLKAQWIGSGFLTNKITDDDSHQCNVPAIRLHFRRELRFCELQAIFGEERTRKILGDESADHQNNENFGFSHLQQEIPQVYRSSHFPVKFQNVEKSEWVDKAKPVIILATGMFIGFAIYHFGYRE